MYMMVSLRFYPVHPALTPVHFEAGTPPERRFRLE